MAKEGKFYKNSFTLHDLPEEGRPRERLKKVKKMVLGLNFIQINLNKFIAKKIVSDMWIINDKNDEAKN